MKNILIQCLLLFICTVHLKAQCPQHAIVLNSQTGVDDFPAQYPGCDSMAVTLTIEGSDITSLQPLSGLTTVHQLNVLNTTNLHSLSGLDSLREAVILIIENTGITNMEGLGSLDSVGWIVRIGINPQLQNLVGLRSLHSVMEFSLHHNPQLVSLQGLDQLRNVRSLGVDHHAALQHLAGMPVLTRLENLYISFNTSLTSLFGLENIIEIERNLIIEGNAALTSIEALYQITEAQDVKISDNPLLPSFAGLGSLTRVTGDMELARNDAIINLVGLQALQRVTGELLITGNEGLGDLSGIPSLRNVGQLVINHNDALISLQGAEAINTIGSVNISFNDLLSFCSVESICEHLSSGGEATIGANVDGCDSPAQVLSGCEVATDDQSRGQILVYPNPARDVVHIVGVEGKPFRVEIWNAFGIQCPVSDVDHSRIDLSDLPAGLYVLRIMTGAGAEAHTLIRH